MPYNEFANYLLFLESLSSNLQHFNDGIVQLSPEQKDAIYDLYEKTLPLVNNQDDFKNSSNEIFQMLKSGQLTSSTMQTWVLKIKNELALSLSIKLSTEKNLDDENLFNLFLQFFHQADIIKEVSSFGKYALAQCIKVSSPEKSYTLSLEAFEQYPQLSTIFNINYTYDKTHFHEDFTENCPFCGSSDSKALYCAPQIEKLNNRTEFSPVKLWKKCDSCQNIFAYNFPLKKVSHINGHYTSNENTTTLQTKFTLSIYDSIFQTLTALTCGRKYLEIGIGTGEMLAVALEYGFDVKAVEICKEDCERISTALDINIICSDILEYNTDEKFDVIVMGDVLEHVSNPFLVLKKVKLLMNQDAILWISTPNYNSAYQRMQKFDHCMWNELNHYTYMSKESLETTLNKLGLEIVKYNISHRYIGSMELCIKQR